MLFKKKCAVCGTEATEARMMPVYGYTKDVKRHFCSDKHADDFQEVHRKILKNHVPGCRTCFR